MKGCSGDASYGCAIKVGLLQRKGACQSTEIKLGSTNSTTDLARGLQEGSVQ